METLDRRVRKYVFGHFVEACAAPLLEEIAHDLGLGLEETRESLKRLDDAHHLKLLEGTSRILMAFPFSALPTPYKVSRDNGKQYYANCAWDSIAFHPMLGEPVQVDSYCAHCGLAIRFRIERGAGIPPSGGLPLVHLRLPASEWWKDITRTCANTMVFLLPERRHQDGLDPAARADRGIVTVDQVLGMSVPIYARKLELDYERPSASVLQRTFEQLGLTGPYWRLG